MNNQDELQVAIIICIISAHVTKTVFHAHLKRHFFLVAAYHLHGIIRTMTKETLFPPEKAFGDNNIYSFIETDKWDKKDIYLIDKSRLTEHVYVHSFFPKKLGQCFIFCCLGSP